MRSRFPALLPLGAAFLGTVLLLAAVVASQAVPVAAADQPVRIQRITQRLRAGQIHVYLLQGLQAGDRLAISMRTTAGSLDPAAGIMDTTAPLEQVMLRYQADVQRLIQGGTSVAAGLDDIRKQYFLAWDDDSGNGYAAALSYTVPKSGDYVLIAASSLSALGRTTAGDYELLIALNAPAALDSKAAPSGAPIAQLTPATWGLAAAVQVVSGTLTATTTLVSMPLVDIDPGQVLSAYVEATSGNLRPILILRDYGGKALEGSNLAGNQAQASLHYTATEGATGYSLEVQAAKLPSGAATTGDFRLLLGTDAPGISSGQAAPQGDTLIEAPIEVQTGLKILRISEVDSQNEKFTVLATLRMDWTDPALAFSPDSCNCSVKLYSDKEIDRFLADVRSRWPAFTFFNQLGNRWIQSRAAAIWPDGRARYAESFNTTFQADFNFAQYPFDTQYFPIYLDQLYGANDYVMVELPGYSGIDPAHGEDEFVITDLTTTASTETPSAANSPVSRLTFAYSAPRHMNYYILQVFLPIILIIAISWFTFFLRDFTRRIEAAAANILLFIAFSWSLADNYPRLGYMTFLDAVMSATFAVNVLVLLYNVYMKRLEGQGKAERIQRIDDVLDWLYPLLYIALIGVVALVFFF